MEEDKDKGKEQQESSRPEVTVFTTTTTAHGIGARRSLGLYETPPCPRAQEQTPTSCAPRCCQRIASFSSSSSSSSSPSSFLQQSDDAQETGSSNTSRRNSSALSASSQTLRLNNIISTTTASAAAAAAVPSDSVDGMSVSVGTESKQQQDQEEEEEEEKARNELASAMPRLPSDFSTVDRMLEANKKWAAAMETARPGFFARLAAQQSPKLLWIGCSDSRVPANQIVNLLPGEVFVHRNVANIVTHTDLNCLSVVQYAVDVLRVRHIMVVGHYGCGGVLAAMSSKQYGLIDNWIRSVKDVHATHADELDRLPNFISRADRLCELNVLRSLRNVCASTVVQNAWHRGQSVTVHGWCYSVTNGLVHDLGVHIASPKEFASQYDRGPEPHCSTFLVDLP